VLQQRQASFSEQHFAGQSLARQASRNNNDSASGGGYHKRAFIRSALGNKQNAQAFGARQDLIFGVGKVIQSAGE
jgi:hypothetical protein